jgi:hypothetical protein
VWDLTNSSPLGRRAFLVFSKALKAEQIGAPRLLQRLQLTLGTGTGRFTGLFAGVRASLPGHVSLVAEYDARRVNVGVWLSPSARFSLRAELQNGEPFMGAAFSSRF